MLDIIGGIASAASGLFGGGGSETTEVPRHIRKAQERAANFGSKASKIGYMPYMGQEVVLDTPLLSQARQATQLGNAAFGLPTTPQAALPDYATQQPNGVVTGSSYPAFLAAQQAWEQEYPGQYNAYAALYPWMNGGGQQQQAPQFGGWPLPKDQYRSDNWMQGNGLLAALLGGAGR